MSTLSRALWRDLRRRPGQILSVGIVIALGVALFASSFDASLNLTASYEHMYRETRFAHVTAIGGPAAEVLRAGETDPAVQSTATRTVADVPLQPREGHILLGRAVGMPPDGLAAVNEVIILEGETLDPSRPDAVLVERHMADHFGVEPGQSIAVATPAGWQDVEVIGIVASPEYVWPARSRQELLVLPDDFGVIFAAESFVASLAPDARRSEVLFRLSDDATSEAIDEVRSAALAAGAADAFTLEEQPSNAALQEDVAGFAEMSVMFPMFFLIAAAFATYVLLGRMIAAQQATIGTLRASGFTKRTILWHYAAIGIVLGLVGAIIGVIGGALLAEIMTRLYTGVLGIEAAVVEVRFSTMAVGLLTGLLTGVVAAALPAREASRISPAAAMRGPMSPGVGGRSLLERLIPPLRNLPVRWLAAIRGMGRARRRSLATIVGVVLSTMLVLVSWGMVDTVQILLDQQFVRIEKQDALLHISGRPADDVAVDVAALDGVDAVESALIAPISLAAGGETYTTTLTALQSESAMHELVGTDGSTLPVPEEGIVVGSALRGRLDIELGDSVTVDVAGLGSSSDVPVVGFVDEPLGTFAYTSLTYATEVVAGYPGDVAPDASAMANALMVTFDDDVDRSAMRSALSGVEGVQAYVDSQGLYELAQSFMGLFYAFIGVMIVLGGVLAFALIYNTMSANVTERAAELAVLRTLGLSRRSIGGLVTAQNMLLTVIGLVPGLLLGWLLAGVFMASFSSDMFSFDLRIRPTTFLFTAAAIFIVGLLSQYPALKAVGRLDLGRIVRDRSF
ncbi:MAG: ABC transporter permease [Chloroflexota bacterium]